MTTDWTIQFLLPDGTWSGAVAFAAASISGASRKLVNQGLDTCQVSFAGTSRPPWCAPLVPGSVVRILRDDHDGANGASNPRGWFVGTVIAPQRVIRGSSEAASLTLNGPWWYLANTVYQQEGLFYVPTGTKVLSGDVVLQIPGVTAPEVSFGETQVTLSTQPYLLRSSDIILTQAQSEGVPMDAAATLQDALAYALAKGARFVVGTLPADQPIPSEQATDPTCADMLKRVLRWLPSVVSWFDYATDPPTLNFGARADRAPFTLQMGGDAPQVQEATLQARPDLVLPGVTLQYLRRLTLVSVVQRTTTTTNAATVANPTPVPVVTVTTTNPSNDSGYQSVVQPSAPTTDAAGNTATTTSIESTTAVNCLEIDTAGPDPDGLGALVATVQLQGGDVNKTGVNTTPFEPTPVGLAAFIYQARSVLSYEGTITLKGQDVVNLGNPLAGTCNILGGDAEWAGMCAEVQTVSENMATGATSITVGPPNHLGPSDLAALLQANRLRQYVDLGTILLRNNGGAPLPPSNPLPPAPPSPGGGGGHVGDPDSDPDEQQGQSPFAGAMELFSGRVAQNFPDLGAAYYPNPDKTSGQALLPNAVPLQAPPSPPDATDAGPGAGGFFHSTSGSYGVLAGGSDPAKGYPGNVGFSGNSVASQSYNVGTLDLTAYPPLAYTYAELRGTYTHSNADGTSTSEPYQLPVSQYLGLRCPGFRIYAPGNGDVHTATGGNPPGGGESQSASVTVDSLWVIPRTA